MRELKVGGVTEWGELLAGELWISKKWFDESACVVAVDGRGSVVSVVKVFVFREVWMKQAIRVGWLHWMTFAAASWVGLAGIAQTPPMPDWQTKAGGHAEFDVVSVRLDKGEFKTPSFALSSDDWFRDPHGRFHADFPAMAYIEFAYKIWPTGEEENAMLAGLPAWVKEDRYALEATAPQGATKDQYRLMMQSMLAERFGLKVHVENKEMPVLIMTLEKPGKTGPNLIPHDQGPPCHTSGVDAVTDCYGFMATPGKDGLVQFGSRGASMASIGKFLGSTGGMTGEISRPVVDKTGLGGLWDFTLQVASPFGKKPEGEQSTGPTVMEGMQEQLGLRLKPAKAVIPVLVVDQIHRPTEN